MTTVADFIKLPKIDFHNNLDLGMRYPSYVKWAGFYVPGFPENGSQVKSQLRNQIKEYTQVRINSEKDVQGLYSLSLSEASADNVTEIYGTLNYSLLEACKSPESFIETVNQSVQKYKEQFKLHQILALDTAALTSDSIPMAEEVLSSNVFTGVYLYGTNLGSTPQKFASFINSVKEKGLNTGINAGAIKSTDDFIKILRTFNPSVMIQGDSAARDKELLAYMRKNNITAVVTPNLEAAGTEYDIETKAHFLRNMLEAGVEARFGTESVLLFNKSISQFSSELVNTGLFTKEEIISLYN